MTDWNNDEPDAGENGTGEKIEFEKIKFYRMCHGFRLSKWDDYFQVTFEVTRIFFEAAVAKIGLSLKPNHHNQV